MTAWSATPGLPFTENFADTSLQDTGASSAEWSTEEQAAYLRFLSQRNASDGSYDSSKAFGTGADTTKAVIFGDVDGDGDLDIAVGQYNGQDAVYLYDSGTDTYGNPINFGQFPSSRTFALDFGDVDGDGDLDIAWGGSVQEQTSVWLYDGTAGTYGNPIYFGDVFQVGAVKFADIDGDGDLDVVVGSWGYGFPETGSQNKVWFYDRDAGTYGNPLNFGPANDQTRALAVGDVDQDGDIDIAVANGRFNVLGQNALYLYNSSTDTYGSAINIGSPDKTTAIDMGDVDGDGDLDITTGNYDYAGIPGQNQLFLFDSATNTLETPINIGDGTDQTAALRLGDMDEDGDLDAVVGNDDEQNAVYLYDKATRTFGNARNFGTGSDNSVGLALGDLDHDGDLDIAVGNGHVDGFEKPGANAVYLYNSKAGTFTGPGSVGAGANKSRTAELGDLDNDGDLDIVVGNIEQQIIAYFFDSSTGTFGNPVSFGPGDSSVFTLALALGDVNGDGFLDVAAGNLNGGHRVYFYDSASKTYPTSIVIDSPGAVYDLAFGDVDRDGDLDLAVGKADAQDQLFFYNSLTNVYENPLSFGDSVQISFKLDMGDINGDGFLDIAVTKLNASLHRVFFGDGEGGGFSTVSALSFGADFGGNPWGMELGDVDNDGDIDIALAGYSNQNRVYLYNHLSGEFDSSIPFGPADSTSVGLALGDVDGDGFLDIAVGTNDISQSGPGIDRQNWLYFYNVSGASYGNEIAFGPNDDKTATVNLGDLDNDGDLDVVSINGGNGEQNRWYRYNGNSLAYASPRVFDSSDLANAAALVCADMDGDGDLDVVAGNGDDANAVHIYDSANQTFINKIPFGSTNKYTGALAVGDVDGDGDNDIVLGQYGEQNQVYRYNSATGTYAAPLNFGTGTDQTLALLLTDVDRDGDLDLIVGNDGEQNWVYTNNGSGVFGFWNAFGTGTDQTRALALGDINGDGVPDVGVGNFGQQNAVYPNFLWTGFFSILSPLTFGTGTDTTLDLSIGNLNLNSDGDPDIAIGNLGNGFGEQNRITGNVANGFLFDLTTFGTADQATLSIDMGDANHDGGKDILTSNAGSQNYLYRNLANVSNFFFYTPIPVGAASESFNSVVLCDLDSDGDLDVVAGGSNEDDQVLILGSYDTASNVIASAKVNGSETNLARVTLAATTTINDSLTTRNSGITLMVSNDGGANWQIAHPGRAANFTDFGSDLRWKAVFDSQSPATTAYLRNVSIEENLLPFVLATANSLRDNFAALDANNDDMLSLLESGLTYLAELKPYDQNNDGIITLSDLQGLTSECIYLSGFEADGVGCPLL